MKRLQKLALGVLALSAPWAAPARAAERAAYVVVHAREVVTVSGETYSPGTVVIEDGRIRLVGQHLEYPRSARVIDARSETVIPGLILARTRYRLPSYRRTGVQAAARVSEETLPAEIPFEEFLRAGYTMVAVRPSGQGLPGISSLYRTAGPEGERLVRADVYLRATLTSLARDKGTLRGALAKARAEIAKIEKARAEWEKKRAEAAAKKAEAEKGDAEQPKPAEGGEEEKEKEGNGKGPQREFARGADAPRRRAAEEAAEKPAAEETFTPPKTDPQVQPLMDILQKKDGALEVVVDLNEASDVVHLLDVLDEYPEVSASLYVSLGRYSDLRRVAEELGERRARVLLRPGLAQLPYTVQWVNPAADLARAGCRPVFLPPSDEPEGFRTVRRDLAGLVRSGLSERTALLGLTLEPARLLGVADRAGSIERGKDADLCFLDGHPLDPLSTVTRVMVRGELVWNGENP